MRRTFSLRTAIAYVNAPPHIGHALEFVQADVIARYFRLKGYDTYFQTGTDEHGQKIFQVAKALGKTPQEVADTNSAHFLHLAKLFHISYDFFIRTSDDFHKRACQKLWKKLLDAGDLYKSKYKGYYCVGCEAFVLEKDLASGKCPIHLKKPELLEEENYFFRLSRYSDQIRDLIETDTLKILPLSRKNEMLNIIGKEGLRDVSFSRPKSVLNWGVTVPDDPKQVMYVWCDALANYITGVDFEHEGEAFQKYWPADVHLIGKDILRFHAGIWIGMLLSADLSLPKSIYVHGFITSEGNKMSKSLGNVVDPFSYIEEFGVDVFRYYLLREIPTVDDGDFSRSRFLQLLKSDLAHSLGNLLHRVLSMVEKYFEGTIEISDDADREKIQIFIKKVGETYDTHISDFNLKAALEAVFELVFYGNEYVDRTKPWILAQEDKKALSKVLGNLLELLQAISELLSPFLPETSEKMRAQLGIKSNRKFVVQKGEPLFRLPV